MIQSAEHHTPVHIHFTSELNFVLQSLKAQRDRSCSILSSPFRWRSTLITLFKWNEHFVVKLAQETTGLGQFDISAVELFLA